MEQGTTNKRLSPPKRRGARDFIVAPYAPGPDGVLAPTLPAECPLGRSAGGPCAVGRKSLRTRKTGPRFPLVVARCHRHGTSFTIYPPGYAPYQRAPVLALSPDGQTILSEEGKRPRGLEAFEGSVFQAALDAKRYRAWGRDSERGLPDRWWSTQRRHLELALELTGISRTIAERTRHRISTVLAVPLLVIREASRTELPGYHQRGAAVAKVLALIHPGRARALRLLLAGHLAGRWGSPRSWNPRSRSA